jgi:hypothetical protein
MSPIAKIYTPSTPWSELELQKIGQSALNHSIESLCHYHIRYGTDLLVNLVKEGLIDLMPVSNNVLRSCKEIKSCQLGQKWHGVS